MAREVLNFNTDWFFLPEDKVEAREFEFEERNLKRVSLPHTNKILPHNYFSEEDYQFVSWYRRPFYISEEYKGKRLVVEFDGVMSFAEVFINGKKVGEHKGGYTSFSFDITDYIEFGKDNLLAVRVDSTRREDIPPEGNVVDYLLFGGIYRDVRLVIVEPVYLDWVFWETKEASTETGIIAPHVKIINHCSEEKKVRLVSSILDQQEKVKEVERELVIQPGENEITLEDLKISNPHLWDIDNPYLYQAICEVYTGEYLLDRLEHKIGIRKVEFKDDGRFYLNDKPLKLRGLNRHQMFPYIGNAMPDRGQKKDAEILKYELGLNFVRSSHYPADPSFLDRCDELGLLVFEEIPGWQHIGDEDWKNVARKNVEEMIVRDRNHPSIFIWGVRINESQDDHDFYQDTNKIAHKLDASRPTGGVRFFQDSEFLEDVFTFNDFEYNLEGKVKLPDHTPHMITEYMGHMYPTKSYDSVERLIKHAVKHAKIQDTQYGVPRIAGASGWCAFDYNTHQDFGSGDRVCYHGVCDMFRLPKFAAHFYKSQQDPDQKPVVFIARYLTPSFNEDYGDEIIVFSNCEEVELYVGDKKVATSRPNYVDYPNLPHPPFSFKGCRWWEWGASTVGSITAVGKIDGEEIERHTIYPFGQPEKLVLTPDFEELIADGADLTRVVMELKDKHDQTLHLAHHPVFFEVEGPGKLIGENPFSLEAGRGAVFIQAGRETGEIKLKARVQGIAEDEVIIETKPLKDKIVPFTKE